MYDFWYKNDLLFTKIWYTFESIFTQKWVSFLLKFTIFSYWFCDWNLGWNHRGTIVKLGENELSFCYNLIYFWVVFHSKMHQKLYKICGWTRVKTSVKSPRSNSEAVQKLYCFDFNFCKICIVLTIICAFFAQVMYHFWSL